MPSTPDPRRPADDDTGGGFFSRWSQRKQQARHGQPLAEPAPAPAPAPAPTAAAAVPVAAATPPAAPTVAAPPAPPAPTAADLQALDAGDPAADFSRFMQPGVDGALKNAALRKLFTDPHFNVMDGLDVYIEDFGQPDPLPPGMLAQLAGGDFLGLRQPEPAPGQPTPGHGAEPPRTAADTAADPSPTPQDVTQNVTPDDLPPPDALAPRTEPATADPAAPPDFPSPRPSP
ncbi:DUF3306 domain-containing protein [Ideonella livida]|uniref:DUF3306 domain-containing protein n=1 Tax=Ideonella livida TaxID=2707176 RepID=A0A7C9TKH0_9BURK|nr:DUF3306 domain-containing protein [Ideonella livida]NDY91842.1 DUF3306 domain-containing protein [Ideonella livida]